MNEVNKRVHKIRKQALIRKRNVKENSAVRN